MPLNTSVRITKQNFNAFLSTQILLIRFLYTQLADIIATNVVAFFIGFHFFCRDFSNITQGVRGSIIRVLANRTPLDIEATEFKQLLLKDATFFRRKLRHKQLISVSGISRIPATVFHVAHDFQELSTSNIQRLAQVECIQVLYFFRDNRYIISRLVKNQQLTCTVIDSSARRILNFIQERIAIGVLLIIIGSNLQYKKTDRYCADLPDTKRRIR